MTHIIAALALAAIIAGEAPGCDLDAKLAVAHVHSRNEVWYGNAEPTAADLYVALHWQEYDDPTDGAVFLIGPGDAAKMTGLGNRTARFECNGTWLEAYRADTAGWLGTPLAEPGTPLSEWKWYREFE